MMRLPRSLRNPKSLLLLAAVSLLFANELPAQHTRTCTAPELMRMPDPEYDRLVCDALDAIELRDWNRALRLLLAADSVGFHEATNYRVLPRIAEVYHLMGERDKALEVLQRAELALQVSAGLIECRETRVGFHLRDAAGVPIGGVAARDVEFRMCGAIYEDSYGIRSLEDLAWKADAVRIFLRVRALVTGAASP
jgi:hypothetical protein